MPVDASIPASAGSAVKPINPLEIIGQIANTTGVINQNKLFKQQYDSNLGIGQIFKEAVGPDGKVDANKLNALLADPKTSGSVSLGLPQAMQQAQGIRGQQITNDTGQLDNLIKHLGAMRQNFSGLLAKPPGTLTQKDVIGMAGNMIAQGMATPDQVAAELANLPPDDAGIRQVLNQMVVQTLDGQAKVQALYGTPQPLNTGGTTSMVAASPFGGVKSYGSITNTLSPESAAGRVPTFQNGQPGTVSMGSLAPNLTAVQPNGASGGNALMQGAMPPAAPMGAPASLNGAPPQPQGDFVPTGARMGQSAAADVAGQASANQGVDLQKAADQVPQQRALLDNMEANLAKFTSGPGADWKQVGKAFVNSNNPFGNIFDPKSIASQEEFNKQSTQLIQSQFAMLGGTGTDAKLDSASHTNPNQFVTSLGNKGIIALAKGNADAIAVKNQEWQKWQQEHGPDTYGQFSTIFNKTYNPRVFQMQYMSPADRADALKSLSKPEQKQFLNSYRSALNLGWVQLPGH